MSCGYFIDYLKHRAAMQVLSAVLVSTLCLIHWMEFSETYVLVATHIAGKWISVIDFWPWASVDLSYRVIGVCKLLPM